MGQGLCADSEGKVINYYQDPHFVNDDQCKQHCNEIGETCIGYSDFDRGGACLLHVSEETSAPEGFNYFQENFNEAQSVETLKTRGEQNGHPRIDYSCFKKMSNFTIYSNLPTINSPSTTGRFHEFWGSLLHAWVPRVKKLFSTR